MGMISLLFQFLFSSLATSESDMKINEYVCIVLGKSLKIWEMKYKFLYYICTYSFGNHLGDSGALVNTEMASLQIHQQEQKIHSLTWKCQQQSILLFPSCRVCDRTHCSYIPTSERLVGSSVWSFSSTIISTQPQILFFSPPSRLSMPTFWKKRPYHPFFLGNLYHLQLGQGCVAAGLETTHWGKVVTFCDIDENKIQNGIYCQGTLRKGPCLGFRSCTSELPICPLSSLQS